MLKKKDISLIKHCYFYSFFSPLRRYFSEEPHLAGSPRQLALAIELEKRWKEYGFDHVEKPEYKALLSYPNTTHPTRITIKYTNGTIIHQIKGEDQVRSDLVRFGFVLLCSMIG